MIRKNWFIKGDINLSYFYRKVNIWKKNIIYKIKS